jgi:SMI1 / KNR4 family (SUKH-1)
MADAHYRALFDRIRAQYRRENWLSPEGRRIDPGLRLAEKLADREDLQRRYYWTGEQGTEYLHRQFYDYDERAGREHIVEVNIPVPYIAYPPATEEQLRATEETLSFPLSPLLRALYAEVANGGVGPVQGIMGAIGGFEDNHGTIVDAYLEKKEHYRLVDLAAFEQWAKPYTGSMGSHRVASHQYVELPRDVWPDRLLEFYHDGCGIFSCIDVSTGRIFLIDSDGVVFYEANSLEEWLERWLQGEMFMEVEETPLSDEFP